MKCKKKYIKIIKDLLSKFNLDEKNIFINNTTGALFKIEKNKKTFYYSYNTNIFFYLYSCFFSLEEKYIDYTKFIRKEKKFKNVDQLKKQIQSDLKVAKKN